MISTSVRVGSIRSGGTLLPIVTVWRIPTSTPPTDVDLDVCDDDGNTAIGRVTCLQSDLERRQEIKVVLGLREP